MKSEARNSKQIRNSKSEFSKQVLNFGHSGFEFVSLFDIRASNFISFDLQLKSPNCDMSGTLLYALSPSFITFILYRF